MTLLIFYLFLALVVSFLCSVMESVLLSTPLSYLYAKEENNPRSAKIFIGLKENIDRPLAAILSLNTVAHTIGAAGVGAQATQVFGEVYFGVISAVLTLLILIFSEIIPKTLGAQHWRRMAMTSGRIIKAMIIITYPLVILTGYISNLISSSREEKSISREEISAMAAIGTEEGTIEKKENRIIQNIFRLKHIKAEDIMTPRVVVAMADESMSMKDFSKNKEFLHFTRIPVYANNREDITGYIFRHGVFEKLAEKESHLTLKDIKRDIVVVREAQSLISLWDILLEKKEHIALVVDEYGGMAGIVTMEDIVESILGLEIVDESDTITDMQQYAREKWNERKAKYNLLNNEGKEKPKKPPQTKV